MNRVTLGRMALAWHSAIAALVAALAVAGPAAQAAPANQPPSQFFQETRFAVDNAAFLSYFQSRGGVQTFGFPVSREFTLQGFPVQIFQRGVLQRTPDGSVRLLNLLDPGLMPITSINFAQLPGPDQTLIAAIPPVEAPNYGPRIADFVRANVPDEFAGLPVNFQRTFVATAGASGLGSDLLILRSLEIWGAPTSRPAFDPNNRGFVYQRFQRGVMHFDAATGTTKGLLLGDSFKSVLTGQSLPMDLERQMQGSPYLRQYDNTKPQGLARPEALPSSDLSNAFEPQVPTTQGPFEGRALVFPDLRTLRPEGLRFGTESIAGASHHVLRFTNTIWNAGEGPLEMRERRTGEPELLQRVYDADEGFVEIPSGALVYHEGHNHWHMGDFARYELWTRSRFDAWQASNRTQGEPEWQADKVSLCLLDTRRVSRLPRSPSSVSYSADCRRTVQGISVGWADVYTDDLPGHWIDLGPAPLPDGQYVLRSIADPRNLIRESTGGTDPNRESEEANAAQVLFTVETGRIVAVAP